MSDALDLHARREARLADIASLGGAEALAGLLSRFAGQLANLLDQPELSRADAHRVVGLSGMLGFFAVEESWRRIEDDQTPSAEAIHAARGAAEEAIAFIAGRIGS